MGRCAICQTVLLLGRLWRECGVGKLGRLVEWRAGQVEEGDRNGLLGELRELME